MGGGGGGIISGKAYTKIKIARISQNYSNATENRMKKFVKYFRILSETDE